MKVKIIYCNLMHQYTNEIPKYTETILQIDDKTTLKDIFIDSKQVNADVSKYYKLSGKYYFNNKRLPYIKKENNKIIWEPSYEKVKVIDFLFTHNIKNNIIYADIGIIQAGGPDLKDFIQLWYDYYPIINEIVTVFGFFSGIAEVSRFIKSIFIDKSKKLLPPHGIFDLILSKKQWNHNELSENLDIDKESTKMILQGLGYKWDNSKKIYVYQGDLNQLRKKLSKVSFIKNE